MVADYDCVLAGLKFAGEIDVDFESVVCKPPQAFEWAREYFLTVDVKPKFVEDSWKF